MQEEKKNGWGDGAERKGESEEKKNLKIMND